MKPKAIQQMKQALIKNNYYDLYDSIADNGFETKELYAKLTNAQTAKKAMQVLRAEVVELIANPTKATQ